MIRHKKIVNMAKKIEIIPQKNEISQNIHQKMSIHDHGLTPMATFCGHVIKTWRKSNSWDRVDLKKWRSATCGSSYGHDRGQLRAENDKLGTPGDSHVARGSKSDPPSWIQLEGVDFGEIGASHRFGPPKCRNPPIMTLLDLQSVIFWSQITSSAIWGAPKCLIWLCLDPC